ncbi:MAG TPA: segregation/condensation protein A [Candidatus Omnitrophota bacterium]|nr:segregation/condensation protein A [Candidatus Omnitrophota bacterium]
MTHKIKLDFFEGPLDLLLYLIKKNEVNIYDIPISEITEQYLQYIELIKLLDLDIVGDFLVMAATLMQIKSKMLLPQPEVPPEEEIVDPRADLVNRLLEYEKYKEAAEELRQRELARKNVFIRPPDTETEERFLREPGEVFFEASLFDLISAFSKALKDIPRETFYEVMKDEFTVEQKIHDILHLLLLKQEISIQELFSKAKSKLEIVANFLATLELIRLKEINVIQRQLFGEIIIMRNKENIKPYGGKETKTDS